MILDHLSDDPAYEFTNVDLVEHADYDGVADDVMEYNAIRPVFEVGTPSSTSPPQRD